jgi:hypothetical protein
MNRLGGWSKPCEHTSQLPKKCKRESRGSFIIASGTTHERGAVIRSRNEISKPAIARLIFQLSNYSKEEKMYNAFNLAIQKVSCWSYAAPNMKAVKVPRNLFL